MNRRSTVLALALVCNAAIAHAAPPAPVTDLGAGAGRTTLAATFTPTTGATSYDLRYSLEAITSGNWDSASPVNSGGCTAGVPVCNQLSSLESCTTYYLAVKVSSAEGTSGLSNVPSKKTKCPPSTLEVGCE